MEIINNLERIIVGDWIKIYKKGYIRSEIFKIGEIIGVNTKVLQFETRQENRGWDNEDITFPDERVIILKIKAEKSKKKKLKHKIKTYNNEYIIFKLNEKEKNNLRNENMLRSLESENG